MPDQVQRAREHVKNIFEELDADNCSLSETALIRDGLYCGHRFYCQEYSAVWFCEENEIKVYDKDRKLLRVDCLSLPIEPLRRAA